MQLSYTQADVYTEAAIVTSYIRKAICKVGSFGKLFYTQIILEQIISIDGHRQPVVFQERTNQHKTVHHGAFGIPLQI